MKFVIINGPNLNLLGKRQPEIYGNESFEDFLMKIKPRFSEHEIEYFQSNHEGDLIDKIHELGFKLDGIVINPGAYTHTSIALADALDAVTAPAVEVHISNIYERESFRHVSFIKDPCVYSVIGEGLMGYEKAINFLIDWKESL